MRIVLDAGHGGSDPGAMGNDIKEKDITLQLAEKTKIALMEKYVCDVLMTREKDEFVSLEERTKFANHHDADFFYSFHANASAFMSASGFESFIYSNVSDSSLTFSYQSVIHDIIQKNILIPNNLHNRGKKRANYQVLRATTMPAMLSEYLFISNHKEAGKLKDESFVDKLVDVTAQGIGTALRLKAKTDPVRPPIQNVYVVQAGVFNVQENAVSRLESLKAAGFEDSFIRTIGRDTFE
jgi:N-acetylmuramoyl-L-alanine amidase